MKTIQIIFRAPRAENSCNIKDTEERLSTARGKKNMVLGVYDCAARRNGNRYIFSVFYVI